MKVPTARIWMIILITNPMLRSLFQSGTTDKLQPMKTKGIPTVFSCCILFSLRLDTELYRRQFGAALSTVFCSATIHSLPGYVSVLLVLEALQRSSKCYRDSAAINS
jgi:hypothetical protein